jgi:hypothetical protein
MGLFSRSAAGKNVPSQQEKPPSDEGSALENGPSGPQPSPQPPLLSLRALSFLYWIWLTPFIKLGNRRAIQVCGCLVIFALGSIVLQRMAVLLSYKEIDAVV